MFNINYRTLFLIFLTLSVTTQAFSDGRAVFSKTVDGIVVIFTEEGLGSGAIISKEGFILTNWHVLSGGEDEILIVVYGYEDPEDSIFNARLIKADPVRDLALLKIIDSPDNLHVIKISMVIPSIGTEVHTVGHPDGEFWSYSNGYISQIRHGFEWKYTGFETEFMADVFQVQNPMSSGNSGGPLLNRSGNLIGLSTFGRKSSELMNFAITAEEILKFLAKK